MPPTRRQYRRARAPRKGKYTRAKKRYAWKVFKRKVIKVMAKSAETKRAISNPLNSADIRDYTTGATVGNARNLFVFNNVLEHITRGDNNDNRQGSVIQIRGIKFNIQFFHKQPPTDLFIKMVLFYNQGDFNTRSVTTGSTGMYTWPGQSMLLGGYSMSSPEFQNLPYDPRHIKVVKQWKMRIPAGPNNALASDTATDAKGAMKYFRTYVRFPRKVTYNDFGGLSFANLIKGQQLYFGMAYDTLEEKAGADNQLGFSMFKTVYYKDF